EAPTGATTHSASRQRSARRQSPGEQDDSPNSTRSISFRPGRNPGDNRSPGDCRQAEPENGDAIMTDQFHHVPVMAAEIVDLFAAVPPGFVLDATLGGGGHAELLLATHQHLGVLGLDRDAT